MTMGWIDSQVMQVTTTAIMATQDHRNHLAVLELAHRAHSGVARKVGSNRMFGVRFVQANAFSSMPQLRDRCVVGS